MQGDGKATCLASRLEMRLQKAIDQRYRQTDDIEIASFDAPHKFRGLALNAVGASFVERLTARHVGSNLTLIQAAECDVSRFVLHGPMLPGARTMQTPVMTR